MRHLVVALAALLVVAACNTGSPGEPPGSEQASGGSGPSVHPDTLVDRWFRSFPGPGPRRCGITLQGGAATVPSPAVERLHDFDFCVVSDTVPGTLRVDLTGPGVQERIDQLAGYFGDHTSPDVPSSAHITGWHFRSDLPLGDYTYRAELSSNGAAIAEVGGAFTVVPARNPTWRRPSNTTWEQADRLDVLFAGHPAGATVEVFLYGPAEETSSTRSYPFVRVLPPAVVGPDGEAAYSWQSEPGLLPGRYAVWLSEGCGPADDPGLCLTTVVGRNG